MLRLGILVFVAALAFVPGAMSARSEADKGKDRPPTALTNDFKTIWMTEWVACNRIRMNTLAHQVHMKVPASRSPQVQAKILANRAMLYLYETDPEIDAAVDGCRNGILWRYYHPG
jgi:hypothetical protein